MKRTISCLLALLMAATAMSCGEVADSGEVSSNNGGNTETSSDETEELTDNLPETNMDGFVLSILHSTADSLNWANIQLDAESENADLINDAIYKRNITIEERFNCEIAVTENPWQDITAQYQSLVMSGDSSYDIIMAYGIETLNNIDYMADMNNLPYIDYEAEWWNPNATSIFKLGTKQVAAAGNFSLSYVSTANCLLFNKRVYDEMNTGENLYDIVRDGKWTTDKFFEVAKAGESDLNGDSIMNENDRMGVTGTVKAFNHMLVIGAGLHYITMDEENYPQFNISSDEKMLGFIEKIMKAQSDDPYLYYGPDNVDSSEMPVDFIDGGCLFMVAWPHNIANYRDMKDDFGIVPAPKYDESQTMYYSNMANGEVATLPRSYDASRAEYIGILLEAMSFYTHHEIIPVYKEVLLSNKLTRDDDSNEMLDFVFEGITYDYGINVWQANVGNKISNEIYLNKNTAIVSTIDSISTTLNAEIEKLKASVEAMP